MTNARGRRAAAVAAVLLLAVAGCSSSKSGPPRPKGASCLPAVMAQAVRPGTPESRTTAVLAAASSAGSVDTLEAIDIRNGAVRSRCAGLPADDVASDHITVTDEARSVLMLGGQGSQLWLRTQEISPDFAWWAGPGSVVELSSGRVVVALPAALRVYGVTDTEALVGRVSADNAVTGWCMVALRPGMPAVTADPPRAPACAALPRRGAGGRYVIGADREPTWLSTTSTPVRTGAQTLPSLSDEHRIYGIASTFEKSYFVDNTGTALVPDDGPTERAFNSWLTVTRSGEAWQATTHTPALDPQFAAEFSLAKASDDLPFVVMADATSVIIGIVGLGIRVPARYLRLDRSGAVTDVSSHWTARPRSTVIAPLIIYWPGQRPAS